VVFKDSFDSPMNLTKYWEIVEGPRKVEPGLAKEFNAIAWHGDPTDGFEKELEEFVSECEALGFEGRLCNNEIYIQAPYPPGNPSEIQKAKKLARVLTAFSSMDIISLYCNAYHISISFQDTSLLRGYTPSSEPLSTAQPQASYYLLRNMMTLMENVESADFGVSFDLIDKLDNEKIPFDKISFDGVGASKVCITVHDITVDDSTDSGVYRTNGDGCMGLSEVRFYSNPTERQQIATSQLQQITSDSIRTSAMNERFNTLAENTINKSGMAGDSHNENYLDSWIGVNSLLAGLISPAGRTGAGWIMYEFDRPYEINQMWVWNYNQTSSSDAGLRNVSIDYYEDNSWKSLGDFEFVQAPGKDSYGPDVIDSRMKSYTFKRGGNELMIAAWVDGKINDTRSSKKCNITIKSMKAKKAWAVDVLNGTMQELNIVCRDKNTILKGILLEDYPVFVVFEK